MTEYPHSRVGSRSELPVDCFHCLVLYLPLILTLQEASHLGCGFGGMCVRSTDETQVRSRWHPPLKQSTTHSLWCSVPFSLPNLCFPGCQLIKTNCHLNVFLSAFPVSITYIRARKIPEQGVQLTGQRDARSPCHWVTRRADAKFQPPRQAARSLPQRPRRRNGPTSNVSHPLVETQIIQINKPGLAYCVGSWIRIPPLNPGLRISERLDLNAQEAVAASRRPRQLAWWTSHKIGTTDHGAPSVLLAHSA